MNFCKKRRGRKSKVLVNVIPEAFTRPNYVSRVSEVYDFFGRFDPVTAIFKLDQT